MNKRIIVITTILLFTFQCLLAQDGREVDSTFTRNFVKSFRFPRDISTECKSSFVSVWVKIAGGKVQGFEFSGNAHQSLKTEFSKLKALFEGTSWESIYPAAGKRKAFTIYIPFVYYQSHDCSEQISSEAFGKVLESAFEGVAQTNPVFMHKPIVYQISQPIQ